MVLSSLNISSEQFNSLFPFYLAINSDLKVIGYGKSLEKIIGIEENSPFQSLFYIKRPKVDNPSFSGLIGLQNQLIVLESVEDREIILRGQFTALTGGESIYFVGSPWFGTMEKVKSKKLTLSDFAIHDPMMDLLHVVRTQELATAELKELLETVKSQREDLKKAARELHDIALFPTQNPDPMIRINDQGEILLQNPVAERLASFEYEDSDVDSKTFWKIIATRIEKNMDRWSFEVRSEGRWYSFVCRYQENEGYFNIYGRDITLSKDKDENIRLLSLIAEENINAVVICDSDGRIVWVNKSYQEITGYNLTELIGQKPGPMLQGPDTDPETIAYLRGQIKKGESFNCEILNYSKSGRRYWIRILGQTLKDPKGNITGYFALEEDITLEKQTQDKIRESETRMFTLIQNLQEGIILEQQDREILFVNPRFCDMFQISIAPEGLIGLNCAQMAEQAKHLFRNPEKYVERIEEIIKDKKVVMSEELELANGRFYELDFVPVTVSGEYRGHLWKYQDISERKSHEKAIETQEEKYRNIIANMNMGILETNTEDLIEYANQRIAEMSGFSIEELIGRRPADLFIPEQYHDFLNQQNNLRSQGQSEQYQLEVCTKSGERRWWLISGAPNYNDQGRFIGSVGICLDMTVQKKMEEELVVATKKAEESSKAKESFLANMSHEIRTPLNAIIGMVRELSREPLTQKQELYLKNAGTASLHLLSIVNDILDLSKIEAGQLQLEMRPFSLREVIEESVSIEMSLASDKMLDLRANIPEDLSSLYIGDSIRIRQILINLLNNSIKFTEKGSIIIECTVLEKHSTNHKLIISVTDTGIGMDEAFLGRIFEKFSQESTQATRKAGGTGLGMRITYELVQKMNGEIRIKSKKGSGTRVDLVLMLETVVASSAGKNEPAKKFDSLKGVRVLLVEDNEMNRLVVSSSLSYHGVILTEATNGAEAIKSLGGASFDVILMDLQMPVMDGLEATRIIKGEMNVETPIIALTANAFRSEIERCYESGMIDYVIKPFEEEVLLNAILRNLNVSEQSAAEEADSSGHPVEGKTYDLGQIEQFSRGNLENIRRMIRLFIDQTPAAVNEIKTAWEAKDLETVRKVAHRIKPTMDLFGLAEPAKDIRAIEAIAAEGSFVPQLEETIDRLKRMIGAVATQLAVDPLMQDQEQR